MALPYVMTLPIHLLRTWFEQEKRAFPWRENSSPYHVWVSEVMLQQTQALRVVEYFNKWMALFPSVHHLARANEAEVLKVWEGLGYYSRARQLLQAARTIVERFGGEIPVDPELLAQIKGLGPYTVGAILSFGFHKRSVAIDANVVRVLTRFYEIEEDISLSKTKQHLHAIVDSILPEQESWVIGEALIELGALVCKKKPECEECPLKMQCKSFVHGTQQAIPVTSKKTIYETLFRDVAVIVCDDQLLLQCGQAGKIMAGLYEFPYFAAAKNGRFPHEVEHTIQQELQLEAVFSQDFQEVKQSFTRYRVTLYPKIFTVGQVCDVPGYKWYTYEESAKLAFSSGHKKILDAYFDSEYNPRK